MKSVTEHAVHMQSRIEHSRGVWGRSNGRLVVSKLLDSFSVTCFCFCVHVLHLLSVLSGLYMPTHSSPFCPSVWQRFNFSSSSGLPLALFCCLLSGLAAGAGVVTKPPSAIRANMQVKKKWNQGLWADSMIPLPRYYLGEMLTSGQLRPHPILSQVQHFYSSSPRSYLYTVFSTHAHLCMWTKLSRGYCWKYCIHTEDVDSSLEMYQLYLVNSNPFPILCLL